MKRPLGVVILAGFYLLGAVLFSLATVVGIFQPPFVSRLSNPNLLEDIQRSGQHTGVQFLLIFIFAAIGLGLRSLHSLARRTVLVTTGLHLVLQTIRFVLHTQGYIARNKGPLGGFFWFSTAISAAIFLYLRQSRVAQAFSRPKS